MLNNGYKLTAVSGRDWHGGESDNEPIAVTYLGFDPDGIADIETSALNALTSGCASITMGPLVTLYAELISSGRKFGIGEEIMPKNNSEKVEIDVRLDLSTRKDIWNHYIEPDTIIINSNDGIKDEMPVSGLFKKQRIIIDLKGIRWIRAELYGKIQHVNEMIAFTNPIYIKYDDKPGQE